MPTGFGGGEWDSGLREEGVLTFVEAHSLALSESRRKSNAQLWLLPK